MGMRCVRMWLVGGVAVVAHAVGCGGEHGSEPEPYCRGEAPAFILDVVEDEGLSGDLSVACRRDGEAVEDVYPCRVPGTGDTESRNAYFTRVTVDDVVRFDMQQTDGYVGRVISVEVRADEALGRVCLLYASDEIIEPCRDGEYPTAECAETGALSITRLPSLDETDVSDLHVAGEVRFADGLEIAFSAPLVDYR